MRYLFSGLIMLALVASMTKGQNPNGSPARDVSLMNKAQPATDTSPNHKAQPATDASPTNKVQPEKDARPTHRAGPVRNAIPANEAPPAMDTGPAHGASELKEPGSTNDFYFRGMARQNARDIGGAIADLSMSIDLDEAELRVANSTEVEMRVELATSTRSAGRIQVNFAAVSLQPEASANSAAVDRQREASATSTEIRLRLAQAYCHRGRLLMNQRDNIDEDLTDFDRAIVLRPAYPSPYQLRAMARQRRDPAGALSDKQKAVWLADHPQRDGVDLLFPIGLDAAEAKMPIPAKAYVVESGGFENICKPQSKKNSCH